MVMGLCGLSVLAETEYLPGVTEEMTDPSFWIDKVTNADQILTDMPEIETLNRGFLDEPACRMNDLTKDYPAFNGREFQRILAEDAKNTIAQYSGDGNYGLDGRQMTESDYQGIIEAIEQGDAADIQTVQYGIAVELADVRSLPTDLLVTDDPADLDYDMLELSTVRVNEPVVIRGQTAEGDWYYCDNFCVSGWVSAA